MNECIHVVDGYKTTLNLRVLDHGQDIQVCGVCGMMIYVKRRIDLKDEEEKR